METLRISEVIARLQEIQAEHGDVLVSTGGVEGDLVESVWFDDMSWTRHPQPPRAYIS